MQDAQNFHPPSWPVQPVDCDIGRSGDHQLPRSLHAANPADFGKFREPFDGLRYAITLFDGGERVSGGNVIDEEFPVCNGDRQPHDIQPLFLGRPGGKGRSLFRPAAFGVGIADPVRVVTISRDKRRFNFAPEP